MSISENTTVVLDALLTLRRSLRVSFPDGESGSGVTGAQAQALLHLAQNGTVSMGALARSLGITFPAATDLVARLEAAGKVERTFSRDDRRRVLVGLTDETRAVAQGVLDDRRQRIAGVLEELPEPERAGFLRGLQMLVQALSASAGVWVAEMPLWLQEAPALVTVI